MQQESESVSFWAQNILVIGIVAVVIFGYLVMLIRKRWKKNFLHEVDEAVKKK